VRDGPSPDSIGAGKGKHGKGLTWDVKPKGAWIRKREKKSIVEASYLRGEDWRGGRESQPVWT